MPADRVMDFREYYRRRMPSYYSGILHLSFTSIMGLAVIAFSAVRVAHISPSEWLTVPITFVFANFVEYRGHRRIMHVPVRFLNLIYQRHTVEHHSFFTHDNMAYESTRDFKMILFPPASMIFFIGLHAVPVGIALYYFATTNIAHLFVITALGYFLTYEWLHLCYHLRENSWVGRIPFLKRLRQHHTVHHNPELMNQYNFNITFPIFDAVFRTWYTPGKTS